MVRMVAPIYNARALRRGRNPYKSGVETAGKHAEHARPRGSKESLCVTSHLSVLGPFGCFCEHLPKVLCPFAIHTGVFAFTIEPSAGLLAWST
jgi:hypothetical protein